MIYTLPDGRQVDLSSGTGLSGQVEAEKATPKEARQERPEEIYPEGKLSFRTAIDLAKQVSWGLNSALLSAPDAVVKAFGEAAGLPKEEIFQFQDLYKNVSGQTAPKNRIERLGNAFGQGAAATLPFTGLLGVVARTKALAGPLLPSAPVYKQIAKETLDFMRTNPKAALAADLGFGGVYGAVEQGVVEATEPGEARDILKATVPFGVTAAIPVTGSKLFDLGKKLVNLSPTAGVARAIATPSPTVPGTEKFDFYQSAVAETIPNIPGVRGPIGFMGNYYGSRAQRTISKQLQDVLAKEGGLEAEEAIALTNAIENIAKQEGFEDARFVFSLPEATLIPTLRQTFNEIMRSASPAVRADINARMDQNVQSFLNVAQKFKPSAPMSMSEALVMHDAQKTKSIKDALDQIEGLKADEAALILDRYRSDSNLADIGSTLRSSILAMRDGMMFKFRDMVDQFTMRPGGVRAPVRKDFVPIEGVPTAKFDEFANRMLAKYKLTPENRLFGGEVPAPAKEIQNALNRVSEAREKAFPEELRKLVQESLTEKSAIYRNLGKEEQKGMEDAQVSGMLRGVQGLDTPIEKEMIKKAEDKANKLSTVNITLPEAMDLLLSAQKYRNYMFIKSQNDLQFGMPRAFADQVDRSGRELLGDVEYFVFNSNAFKNAPGIGNLESAYRDMFTKGFDKLFPLLATRKRPTGEFEISDQRLVEEALKNRDNLRSLNTIFGENHPTYAKNLEEALLAKARQAGAIGKDGLIDVPAYNRFISGLSRSGVMDELPPSVQATLRNDVKTGQAFADDIAKQKAAVDATQDAELDALIKNSIRPDADPGKLIRQAMDDPAVMRKLVNTVGKDEPKLQAMRREFWEDLVGSLRNETDPTYLNEYLTRYGKSLNMLYTPEHLNNLKLLGAIQERVFAVNRPEGALSPFRTFDVKLREKVGAGVGTIESTARAAMIRQISPQHAIVSLLSRFFTRQQQSITDKILLNALTNPDYAARLVAASAPLATDKGFKQAAQLTMEVGGYLPSLLKNVPRVASIEAVQAIEPEQEVPFAQVPREAISPAPARRPVPSLTPLQQQGVVPPRMGLGYPTPATSSVLMKSPLIQRIPSQPPADPNYAMYQALFPQDVVSPLIRKPQ
jgi:hypothetical protein